MRVGILPNEICRNSVQINYKKKMDWGIAFASRV
jgi:hypothetical protein